MKQGMEIHLYHVWILFNTPPWFCWVYIVRPPSMMNSHYKIINVSHGSVSKNKKVILCVYRIHQEYIAAFLQQWLVFLLTLLYKKVEQSFIRTKCSFLSGTIFYLIINKDNKDYSLSSMFRFKADLKLFLEKEKKQQKKEQSAFIENISRWREILSAVC